MDNPLFFMFNGNSGDGLDMIDKMDLSVLSSLLRNKPVSSSTSCINESSSNDNCELDSSDDDDSCDDACSEHDNDNEIQEKGKQDKLYKKAAKEAFQSLTKSSKRKQHDDIISNIRNVKKKTDSNEVSDFSSDDDDDDDDEDDDDDGDEDDEVVDYCEETLKLDLNHISRQSEILGMTKEKKNQENVTPFEPYVEPLYISTKSIISFLNTELNLKKLLWQLPTIPYRQFEEGIIKKQFKLTTDSEEELKYHLDKLVLEKTWQQSILQHIDNDSSKGSLSRGKFKDVRKISVGVCKKDILSNRVPKKPKGVFYNCLVIIVRLYIDESFSEFHVKLFNTGKVEIPGIKTWDIYEYLLQRIVDFLSPFVIVNPISESSSYLPVKIKEKEKETIENLSSDALVSDSRVSVVPLSFYGQRETVLINSNFKCNFLINREKLVNILRNKYNVECHYNGDNYPAIKCHYIPKTNITSTFFDQTKNDTNLDVCGAGDESSDDDDDETETISQEEITRRILETRKYVAIKKANKIRASAISFMIFRTGSVLIVGRCSEDVLYEIYEFVKDILIRECHNIVQEQSSFLLNSSFMDENDKLKIKEKKEKIKRGIVIGKSKMKQLKKKIQIPMSLFTKYIPKLDIVNNIDVLVHEIKSGTRISKNKVLVSQLKGQKKKKNKNEKKHGKLSSSSSSSSSSIKIPSKVIYAFKQVEPIKKNNMLS